MGEDLAWIGSENSEQTRLNKSQISFALDRSLKDLDTDYIDPINFTGLIDQ